MRHQFQRGFSLVELMVTVAVALLLLVGIARVFLTSKQSYRVQESTSRMQENIRIASDYFNRYVRVADFWGGASAPSVSLLVGGTYAGKGSCTQAWITNPGAGLVGYTGNAGNPVGLPAGCLSNYIDGSDALVVRGASPDEFFDEAGLATAAGADVKAPFYVRSLVGQRALLFHRASGTAAQAAIPCPVSGCAGVSNHRYRTSAFYIQSSNFGTGIVPTLAMLHLERDALESEPLVDGIEMLAFAYGLDTNDDLQVDSYREAGDIANWSQVLSVRVSFIARGDELDNVVDTAEYAMTASRCYGPATSSCPLKYSAAAARYQRRLVVQEIQLRNRVRG